MRRFLSLLLCLLIGLPASSPRLAATGFDAAGDESNAENSAAELIAADPKLKSWMQAVPLAIQQELSRSIDRFLADQENSGKVIAVGKFDIPEGTVIGRGGIPAGGVLLYQQQQRLNVSFGGSRRDSITHWPWFVASLHPGKPAEIGTVTLQHRKSTTTVPDTQRRSSVLIPSIKIQAANKDELLTVKATLIDGEQAIPGCVLLSLPGFYYRSTVLTHSDVTGELEFTLPKDLFEFENRIDLDLRNYFYEGVKRQISEDDFSGGVANLGTLELKPRQSHMVSGLITKTKFLKDGYQFRINRDYSDVNFFWGSMRPYSTPEGHVIRVSGYGKSMNIVIDSMTHLADLGTEFENSWLKRPVAIWLDENDLQPVNSLRATVGHNYLIKCRESPLATAPLWGIIRIEKASNAFDNFVVQGKSFGPRFRELANRFGRFPYNHLPIANPIKSPRLDIAGPLDDEDMKLVAGLEGDVNVAVTANSLLSVQGFKDLARSRAVKSIGFHGRDVSVQELQVLTQSNLTGLKFLDCKLPAKLRPLLLRSVTKIELKNCTLDGTFVAALARCPSLTELEFENCSGLQGQEAVFQYLPRGLKRLELENCQINAQLRTALNQQRGGYLYVRIVD
ncbi:hypothetical protein NZK35_28485 [Stieleria sp. ICT_E10.1]|uniref:hypothetical protein n=1 Tax=Stieleria sedimenti TaxID=2976331 RepID=UPI0021801827|nr:hypothetical protein [Stieleria sedimenti]MCS7470608.1 hypothetical protein [Stieleria sedimenti]